MKMKIRVGAVNRRGAKWDNVVEFSSLRPPADKWPELRRVIAQCGGKIGPVYPLRVALMGCAEKGAKAREVVELVRAVKALKDGWECAKT